MNPDSIKQFLDISPPVVMWIALNITLYFLKRVPGYPTWTLPLTALALGGLIYPAVTDPGKVSYQVRCPVCLQILTGMAAGGMAVLTHQQFKQFLKRFGASSDTEFKTKDDYDVTNEKSPPANPTGGPV